MADTCIPDVLDIFQHKILTHIVGQPHFGSLQVPSKELKANVSLVPSTLGGGMYGHLGPLLTSQKYATLSEEGFTIPTNPGPFTPEAQIREAREVWKEAHYSFHLCQAVERALISQVVAAVESPYLDALWNTNTSPYGYSNLKLLQHLSTTYGHITPQQLKAK